MNHAPLNQAGIIVSPRAHYLEDPPRIVGFKGVLNTRATSQSHTETGVPFAIRNGNGTVLIRWSWGNDAPIKPTGFTTGGTSFQVALSGRVVFLQMPS